MTSTTDPKPGTCRCGCGQETKRHYRPGHDARHVSQLTQAIADGVVEKRAALRALPTEPLKQKLNHAVAKQPRRAPEVTE